MINRIAFALYRAIGALVRTLPLHACCRLGRALGTLFYYLLPGYRALATHNLSIAFGREKSPAEIKRLAREHFGALGANLLASLKISHLPPETILSIVKVEGADILHKTIATKRGFVGIVSHLGNWELLSQISPLIFGCPGGAIYQKLSNAQMDAEVRASRARLGVQLFERKEGFQGAMQMLRAGGAVGVLVDQHAGDAGVWCPFFDRLASTSSLAAMLALRTGATLLPMAVFSDGPGKWRMIVEEPIEPISRDPAEVTAQINRHLEQQIRRQPADWFWVHNRWKTPKPKFLLAKYKRGIATDPKAPIQALQPFRIVIRASNWLGDAVMSAPAVRAIRNGRPDAHVTILTQRKLADFWKTLPEVDAILTIEPEDTVFKVAAKLRGQFDVAIVMPNSLRTALEAFLAGIPRRVGYAGHRRKALLNQVFIPRKPPGEEVRHQVNHYLALAQHVGAPIENIPQVLTRNHGRKGAPVLGLCPGAEYGGAKRWLPERYAEVMQRVHEQTKCEWRLFGVAKDRPIADSIVQAAAPTPCTDLVGKTSLAQLIEHLRQLDLLLTNDTGTMHLAAALGVPVVAIFGSTDPELTGPLGPGHRILRETFPCSPCFLRECPIDFPCMHAITVPVVVAAIEQCLEAASPALNKTPLQ